MIKIEQIKMPLKYTDNDLLHKISKELNIEQDKICNLTILKKSIDARKRNEVRFVLTVAFDIKGKIKASIFNKSNVGSYDKKQYSFNILGDKKISNRPVIVGAGPAGLFAAYLLAEAGYKPLIIERGDTVDKRIKKVKDFWSKGELDVSSNVQFGEGGAGTFSDGKLNTMIKDISGRQAFVLETFVKFGANEEILYVNKPHIGTDVLRRVVKNIRLCIEQKGGEFMFNTQATDLIINNNEICGIEIKTPINRQIIDTNNVILAIGHSSRDTFSRLVGLGAAMQAKAFAVGVRIEHLQDMVNMYQYGTKDISGLPVADYKLTHQCRNGRGIYSFCMCPGGFVVNASSEEGAVVVNGMSNSDRANINSNSALIVTVTPKDFEGEGVLSGVEFQKKWEKLAFEIAGRNYSVPIQKFDDFKNNVESNRLGEIMPSVERYTLTNVRKALPEYVAESIVEGVEAFENRIKGFSNQEAIISGVEMRTSSPLRIIRDENYESNIKGLFPCGEGAGYAGGITSAAIDGIKVAEEIAKRYKA